MLQTDDEEAERLLLDDSCESDESVEPDYDLIRNGCAKKCECFDFNYLTSDSEGYKRRLLNFNVHDLIPEFCPDPGTQASIGAAVRWSAGGGGGHGAHPHHLP